MAWLFRYLLLFFRACVLWVRVWVLCVFVIQGLVVLKFGCFLDWVL